MAVQCSGNVLSGANAAYTAEELGHQLSDSSTAVVRRFQNPSRSIQKVDTSCIQLQILCHPQVLEVALAATTALGWSKKKQRAAILLAVPKNGAGPAGDRETSAAGLGTKS